MKVKLRACPFCNGKAKRTHGCYNLAGSYGTPDQDRTWYGVACTGCGISQPRRMYHTREESDTAWNKRSEV